MEHIEKLRKVIGILYENRQLDGVLSKEETETVK